MCAPVVVVFWRQAGPPARWTASPSFDLSDDRGRVSMLTGARGDACVSQGGFEDQEGHQSLCRQEALRAIPKGGHQGAARVQCRQSPSRDLRPLPAAAILPPRCLAEHRRNAPRQPQARAPARRLPPTPPPTHPLRPAGPEMVPPPEDLDRALGALGPHLPGRLPLPPRCLSSPRPPHLPAPPPASPPHTDPHPPLPPGHPQGVRLKVAATVVVWYGFSMGLSLFNKRFLGENENFHFASPMFVTGLQARGRRQHRSAWWRCVGGAQRSASAAAAGAPVAAPPRPGPLPRGCCVFADPSAR